MKIAIKDANIIFDLFDMELLEITLSLDYEFITTDFVKSEIKTVSIRNKIENLTDKKLLKIIKLDYEQLKEVSDIQNQQKGLSISDCSVVLIEKKYNAILLTGDKLLRNKAQFFGIENHGILWILDELVSNQKITPEIAFTKLELLMKTNIRLPISECTKRLEKWETTFNL